MQQKANGEKPQTYKEAQQAEIDRECVYNTEEEHSSISPVSICQHAIMHTTVQ